MTDEEQRLLVVLGEMPRRGTHHHEGLTVSDLASRLGLSEWKTRNILRALEARYEVTVSGGTYPDRRWRWAITPDGINSLVIAWPDGEDIPAHLY